jgi:predicted TIM-barrel fold metal-dependent hydrolase
VRRDEGPQSTQVTIDSYVPQAMVRLRQTDIQRARYPVVDAHNHFRDSWNVDRLLRAMDDCHVRVFVDLSGMHGERLKRRLDLLKGQHPERFAVFYVPDFLRVNEPDFGEREALALENAVQAGVQGLKIFKSLGLNLRDAEGQLLHVNDPRFFPIWQAAGELGIPVLIHVADPFAFFEPLDARNERYRELNRHPDWHFYGAGFPPLQQLLTERDAIVAAFPNTNFIGAHIGSESEDLTRASQALERYPNYYVDFSARQAELGRQPRRTRQFFLEHQDRIVFGLDGTPSTQAYRNYFRFLETDDECFEYHGYPGQGFWHISGIHLPDEVLRKVYWSNAARLIPGISESQL